MLMFSSHGDFENATILLKLHKTLCGEDTQVTNSERVRRQNLEVQRGEIPPEILFLALASHIPACFRAVAIVASKDCRPAVDNYHALPMISSCKLKHTAITP